MKTKCSFILSGLLLATAIAAGQTQIEAKQGQNVLLLEVYNRTSEALPALQVRFAESGPEWFTPRSQASGKLLEYRGENDLKRNKTRLQIPFEVAAGYNAEPVKLEILHNNAVIGTFDVVLSFADRPPYSVSSRTDGFEELQGKTNDFDEQSILIPEAFALKQNYPNPFNPTTTIRFDLPEAGYVSLKLYDLLGQEIRTLVNGDRTAGFHTVSWDGKNDLGLAVPSGIYLYRIVSSNFVQTQRMTLIR